METVEINMYWLSFAHERNDIVPSPSTQQFQFSPRSALQLRKIISSSDRRFEDQ
jgi:hypothetical protein